MSARFSINFLANKLRDKIGERQQVSESLKSNSFGLDCQV